MGYWILVIGQAIDIRYWRIQGVENLELTHNTQWRFRNRIYCLQAATKREIDLILCSFVLACMANDVWLDHGSSNVISRIDSIGPILLVLLRGN